MLSPRRLALLGALWASAMIVAPARAGLVLSTFPSNSSELQTGNPGLTYGQEFQAGTADLSSLIVRIQLDPGSLPTDLGQLHLVLDSSNNGAIGSTFFDGFTASAASPSTGVVTFAPHGGYTLSAGVDYWLVLTSRDGSTVSWDFSSSATDYQTASGYGIPSSSSSYFDDGVNPPSYTDLSDGPQIFSLDALPRSVLVPEPSSLTLVAIGLLALARRRPAASAPARSTRSK
jgi:PEP-CTERM motif